MISVRYNESSLFFVNDSNLGIMSSEVKSIIYWLFLQQSSGIIESVIGGITYCLRMIALSFYAIKSSVRQMT